MVTRANISDLDANDIESIEILKGATASSYYGSNAANGVINIVTKRGRNLAEGSVPTILRMNMARRRSRMDPENTTSISESRGKFSSRRRSRVRPASSGSAYNRLARKRE